MDASKVHKELIKEICPYCKYEVSFETHAEGFKVCPNCRYIVCMPKIAFHEQGLIEF